jgi:transcriptional regulator with XRE-family HTH domain
MARTSTRQKLAKGVKHYRNAAGLSQEKLGINSGLGRSYISGVECCERNPSLESLEKIAKALKIGVSDLTRF